MPRFSISSAISLARLASPSITGTIGQLLNRDQERPHAARSFRLGFFELTTLANRAILPCFTKQLKPIFHLNNKHKHLSLLSTCPSWHSTFWVVLRAWLVAAEFEASCFHWGAEVLHIRLHITQLVMTMIRRWWWWWWWWWWRRRR